MNGAVDEDELSNGHTHEAPSEAQVQTIIQSIQDASSLPLRPDTITTDTTTDHLDQFDEGEYWDYSSMAPLNAASAVSTITPN